MQTLATYIHRALRISPALILCLAFSPPGAFAQTAINSDDVAATLQRLRDKSSSVRAAAARELGNTGRVVEAFGTVPPLTAALGDPDVDVRRAAAFALGAIGSGDPMPGTSADLRKQTVDTAVPALVKALQTDTDAEVRQKSATSLGYFGSDAVAAVPALTAALDDQDSEVRQYATDSLVRLGKDAAAAIPFLMKDLQNPDYSRRSYAARVLGAIGPGAAQAVPALLKTLRDTYLYVRMESAAALGTIGQRQADAVPVLVTLLSQDDYSVRARAAGALGQFGLSGRAALPALTRALNDEDADVRHIAAFAIEKIDDAIRQAHDTTSIENVRAAEMAIENSHDPQVARRTGKIKDDLETLEVYSKGNATKQVVTLLQKHSTAAIVAAVWLMLFGICLLLLWLSPLTLLRLNSVLKPYPGIELPAWITKIKLSPAHLLAVGFFEYHPRVLDAWVAAKLKPVRQNFEQLLTVSQREIYIETPVTMDGCRIAAFTPAALRSSFAKSRNCILIVGEGGAGKTSLACQIARWSMATGKEGRCCADTMLPVLIEEDLVETESGKDAFIETIRGQLRYAAQEENPPPEELVNQLVKHKRILVIVDGLSEKSELTRRRFHPENPHFPLNAVVVTSRLEEKIGGIDVTLVKPMRIQGNRLSSFMDAYLVNLAKRDLFDDLEFFNACGKLSAMVGEREVTVLLARMYAEQMVAAKQQSTETEAPANVPSLMLEYVNQLNRGIGDGKLDDRVVQRAAMTTAWLCLRHNYQPGAATIDPPPDEFAGLPTPDQLTYMEHRLRIVQTVGTARNQVRFSLDPLAEYLAALFIMQRNGSDETPWRSFLQGADMVPGSPQAIRGFLLALRDCCLSLASQYNVPDSVQIELARRLGVETPARDTLRQS